MKETRFTAKTTRSGWADLFLDGQKVGYAMSYNTGYGYWKAEIWSQELRQLLIDGNVRVFSDNTRKALIARLNDAI